MRKWLKSTEFIKFSVKDRIARVTLNRPEKRNAIHDAMKLEIRDAMLEADDLVDVTVVILEGEGVDFCAGADINHYRNLGKELEAARQRGEKSPYRSSGSFDDDVHQLEIMVSAKLAAFDIHKPVIAKIQGHCLGEGSDLMLGCDMVIAAENAKIGFPPGRAQGTPPNNWWLYHVGPQWSKRMLFTGDFLWGRDAARLGLAMDAVPAEQLEEAVMSLAVRIAACDSEMLSVHKRAVNLGMEMMGARTMQRLAAEFDVRAHFVQGPRREEFRTNYLEKGLKEALRERDRPFGDNMVRIGSPQPMLKS